MFKYNLLLLVVLFIYTLEGSGYYSGDFEMDKGVTVKTEWLSSNGIKLDITIRIESSECIANANIGIYLMTDSFFEDSIISKASIPNKVGVYDLSLSAPKENGQKKYYVFLKNHCGFTATGNIYIEYDY